MPSNTSTNEQQLLRQAAQCTSQAMDPSGPPVPEIAAVLTQIRAQIGRAANQIDLALVSTIRQLAEGIRKLKDQVAKLAAMVADLSAEPWNAAIFLRHVGGGPADGDEPARAEVLSSGSRRVVLGIDRSRVDPSTLVPGQRVFVNSKGSAIVLAEDAGSSALVGETAVFVRWLDEGSHRRLVLNSRDEEIVVEAVGVESAFDDLTPGNRVRFSREGMIAFETIAEPDAGKAKEFASSRRSPVSRANLGGQTGAYAKLELTVFGALMDPVRAVRYGLKSRNVVFLVGPPGTGKTLMARIAADEAQRRYGKTCHFASVKPAEWEDPYFGVSQQKVRAFFANCRKLAADGLVVAYIDEIDAIGRHRGGMVSHHSDKVLGALLAEIEGIEGDANIVLICASNRKDLLDAALTSRMGVEIHVGRPDARAAREIFGIHLGAELSYSPNGSESPATRNRLIDRAIALLFGNGEESEVARVRFADGKSRTVKARELVSGRLIQQICEASRRSAFERDLKHDDRGIRQEDTEAGVHEALAKMRSSLTKQSIHAYLDDLPQDIAVVAVEPLSPKVANPSRYRLASTTPTAP